MNLSRCSFRFCRLTIYSMILFLFAQGQAYVSADDSLSTSAVYDSMTSVKLNQPSQVNQNDVEYFDFLLKPKNKSGLMNRAYAVNTPGNSEFKKFITPKKFRSTYGYPKNYTDQWVKYLKQNNLETSVYDNGLILSVHGKVSDINNLFKVDMNQATYHNNPLQFGDKIPSFPKQLSKSVWSVIGITDHNPKNINSSTQSITHTSNTNNNYPAGTTKRFTDRYHVNKLYEQGLDGKGQTIAIIGFGGVQNSNLTYFWKNQNASADIKRLSTCNVEGPVYKDNSVDNNDIETTMDLEYAGSVAPKANLRLYEGSTIFPGFTNFINLYATVFDENIASSVSSSWSLGPYMDKLADEKVLTPNYGEILNIVLAQGALEGISNFTASGDAGAFNPTITGIDGNKGTQDYELDAEDPLVTNPFITSVGGTTLPFKENLGSQLGVSIGDTTVKSERAWGYDYLWPQFKDKKSLVLDAPQVIDLTGGSGGGFSKIYETPKYQLNVSGVNTFNARNYFSPFHQPIFDSPLLSGVNHGRNYPDVSANADSMTGYNMYFEQKDDSSWIRSGGTSITSPQIAAVAAVINSEPGRKRMGFWNSQIYELARTGSSPFKPLNSTTDNSNLYYTGQPGKLYNQATGLGTIDFAKLAKNYR